MVETGDVLNRDVPGAVLVGVDANAARLGLSRVEYIRRRLAANAANSSTSVSTDDLSSFADRFSALVRLADSPDAETWAARIERGLVRITTVTRLEIGYSARGEADARSMLATSPLIEVTAGRGLGNPRRTWR